jgi:hypothetical protein
MSKKKGRLAKSKKRKPRKARMSDIMMRTGAGLAVGGAVAGGLGYAKGGELMGAGLGLAGAGLGVGMMESIGEGLQKSARGKRRKF